MLCTMQSFAFLLAVILGSNSPLYLAYRRDIVGGYNVVQPRLETLANQYLNELIHVQLLHWIQLRLQEYWSEAEIVLGPVELPNSKLLFEAIRYKQWICPEIPSAYVQKKRLRITDLGGTLCTRGTTSSKKKTETPATGTTQRHAYQRNEAPIQDLVQKGSSIGRIAVFVKVTGESVPKSDNGRKMCIAYHTKGGCYKDCAHAIGHSKLNEVEAPRLQTYVKNGLEKMEAPTLS
jgi:hypothetical protein